MIKQKFFVDGCDIAFDSEADAQAYIDSNQFRIRAEAYGEHLKTQGAQRISKKLIESIVDFLQYEESERAGFNLEAAPGKNSAPPVEVEEESAETAGSSPVQGVEDSDPKPADIAAEQEEPASEPAQDAKVLDQSKHVDGPNEELEEDPLAGLDLED